MDSNDIMKMVEELSVIALRKESIAALDSIKEGLIKSINKEYEKGLECRSKLGFNKVHANLKLKTISKPDVNYDEAVLYRQIEEAKAKIDQLSADLIEVDKFRESFITK